MTKVGTVSNPVRDELSLIEERHYEYFAAIAAELGRNITGPAAPEWLDRVEREHNDMKLALDRAVARGDAEKAMALVVNLSKLWSQRGYSDEGLERIKRVLELEGGSETLRAGLLIAVTYFYFATERNGESIAPAAEALEIARAGDDPALLGRALMAVAMSKTNNSYGSGTSEAEAALAIADEIGDEALQCQCLILGGTWKHYTGDPSGRQMVEDGLAIARRIGHQGMVSMGSNCIGHMHQSQGDLATARRYFEEDLKVVKRLRSEGGYIRAYGQLVECNLLLGDFRSARDIADEGVGIMRSHRNKRGLAHLLVSLGSSLYTLGHLAEARRALEEAIEISPRSGSASLQWALRSLVTVLLGQNDFEGALELLQRELESVDPAEEELRLAILSALPWPLVPLGRFEEAKDALQQAAELSSSSVPWFKVSVLEQLGFLLEEEGLLDEAEETYKSIEAVEGIVSAYYGISLGISLVGIARIHRKRGDVDSASGPLLRALDILEGTPKALLDAVEEASVLIDALGDSDSALSILGAVDAFEEDAGMVSSGLWLDRRRGLRSLIGKGMDEQQRETLIERGKDHRLPETLDLIRQKLRDGGG